MVDDLIIWSKTQGELVNSIKLVSAGIQGHLLYVVTHTCRFFGPSIGWRGLMRLSGGGP